MTGALPTLAALEPLAGAALAINLAYLALDRFRYRQKIEPAAEIKCAENEQKLAVDGYSQIDAVRELEWLARRDQEPFAPRGRGAFAYRWFFRSHQDIWGCVLAVLLNGFVLAGGVAQNIGRWEITQSLNDTVPLGTLFYLQLASAALPLGLVWLGRRCVVWGQNRINHCHGQIAIFLENLAKLAQAPVIPSAANESDPPPSKVQSAPAA